MDIRLDISSLLVYGSGIFLSWCTYYSMISLDGSKHKNLTKHIIFSLIIWVTLNITKSINDLFISFILNALVLYFIYYINRPNEITRGLIVVFVLYLFIIIGDIFISIIFINIYKEDIVYLINNNNIKIISNLIVGFIILLSNLKIVNVEITKLIDKITKMESLKNILLYIILVLFGFSIIYMYYLTKSSNFYGFLIIVLFLAISCICLMEMKRKASYKESYEETSYKYDELKTYADLNENLISELRKQKHDNKNAMIVLKGMIKENKISALEEMIDKMIGDNISIENEDINRFMYIKETGLKYLFLHKYIIAKNKNIHVLADIQKNMEDIDFSNYQQSFIKSLYTIIGIILDNAIEATSESSEASIAIQVGYIDTDINIYVINTYKNEPDMNQIKLQGYSTKGKNRGYGLKILSEICNTYKDNLSVETYLQNGLFTQHIIIKHNK
ncbi:MAG: GHKL domain-containing protein [Tissierellia bacterium]|nr:GHKL domain-containing protein [Tissierellia bacterium]MDD4780300.1 GHKL domain-containing protein [Tissierellia bacterium]